MEPHIQKGLAIECPHCGALNVPEGVAAHDIADWWEGDLDDPEGYRERHQISAHVARCANSKCQEWVVDLVFFIMRDEDVGFETASWKRVHPSAKRNRPAPSALVPSDIRASYLEAAEVEAISQKCAALMARRCLQETLRDKGYTHKSKRLNEEIEAAAADFKVVTSTLRTKLHLVRQVGNYAAHPTVDENGETLNVEAGEVDALFAVLEEAFDVFYVRPEQEKELFATMEKKLKPTGKSLYKDEKGQPKVVQKPQTATDPAGQGS